MTHNPSRKRFFAKLLGVAAAVSLAPKALLRTVADRDDAPTRDAEPVKPANAQVVRTEPRAVARRDGTF